MMNEIASSYDDLMSETLNGVKHHKGQQIIAAKMREIAAGSKMLLNREEELYHRSEVETFEHKVQPYYSLRCIPQVLGPILDTIDYTEKVLMNELNSVDDNPIVDPHNRTVIHGGIQKMMALWDWLLTDQRTESGFVISWNKWA